MTTRTLLLALSVSCATSLGAQSIGGARIGLSQRSAPAFAEHGYRTPADSGSADNHWVRGAVVGGAIGTLIGVGFYNAFESEAHGRFYIVVWAFAGAVVGSLVGG